MKHNAAIFGLPKPAALATPPGTSIDETTAEKFIAKENPPVAPRVVPTSSAELAESGGRLVVNLTPSIHRRLKVRCAERGITIRSYLMALLEADGLG